MKPTTDGNWAHVVCALAVPEVSFLDVPTRSPVDVSKLTAGRQKLVWNHLVTALIMFLSLSSFSHFASEFTSFY